MKSQTPKVLHEVAGRSMLGHVLARLGEADIAHVCVVVGPGQTEVQAQELSRWDLSLKIRLAMDDC